MPLSNECMDCVLYLSGEDIRQLLSSQRQSLIEEVEGMKIKHKESKEGLMLDFCEECVWNNVLDLVIKKLKED